MRIAAIVVLITLNLVVSIQCMANEKQIKENLSKAIPGLQIKTVNKSKMDGIFQVETIAGETLFSDSEGRFFLTGDLYSTQNNELVNLSEESRAKGRAEKINAIPDKDKIVFAAKGERKGKIAVFTDIDCGYCRKLHKEVPELNAMGVEVSYLAYPRAGINSESYNKYVSAWCADDKQTALTDAKNGRSIEAKVCENPVANQFGLGRAIGISGTPAIILQDGTLIPGYVNAQKIGQALGVL